MRIIMGRRLKRDKRGVSNIIVVVLSLIIIVVIVANVILWSYQMNQTDWEKMQENVKITTVNRITSSSWSVAQSEYTVNRGSYISGSYADTQTVGGQYERFMEAEAVAIPTYYPNGYNVVSGAYVSGSIPSSVQTVDTNYFIVNSAYSATSTTAYNPSGYSLLGFTTLASGSLSNLVSDDGLYMTFRSYPSTFSSTSYTRATISYRSNTGTNLLLSPKNRAWNGTLWDASETEMSSAGSPVRWVRVAYCPLDARYYEKIVATVSDDGNLDLYVWNGTAWIVTNNVGNIGNPESCSFDIEYEKTSGNAIIVYANYLHASAELGYRVWNGTSWSGEYVYDLVAGSKAEIRSIELARKPTTGANEIAIICVDKTNADVYGLIWNGSALGNQYQLETNVGGGDEVKRSPISVAYEKTSGNAMFVWSYRDTFTIESRRWLGTIWESSESTIVSVGDETRWLTLKTDPTVSSNRLMLVCVDKGLDLNTADWNGAVWTAHTEHDNNIDNYNARVADFAWEPSGSKGLLAWGTADVSLSYKTFTSPSTWSSEMTIAAAGTHPWVQLRENPRDVSGDTKILGAMLNSNNDLGALKWNGATLTNLGDAIFTEDTTVTTFECFDIAFQPFGDPTEYTSEVEFGGSSNTASWTQLNWTIDSAWTTGSVSVALQLYNYNAGQYPITGDGYLSYTSNVTANIDETKTQTITTNPEHYRNSSGNWKIKIKGVKAIGTQFQFKADWIEFKPTYYSQYTVSTEFTFSSMTTQTPAQLTFTIVSEYNIASVSVKIQVWNYSSSAYVTSGEGYLEYTSSGSNETKSLSINTNPQFYTANGNAKIKITGVKSTTSQYLQKTNQVKLDYKIENRLDIDGTFIINLSTYPIAYIQTLEIQLRYNASDSSEKWYLKTYNWTAMAYSNNGFNSTIGHTPTTEWSYYTVNLTDEWQNYVHTNGTMHVKFHDEDADDTQTTIDIDFLGVRVVIDGSIFTFKNEGSQTSHLVSLWIINSTHHRHYNIDLIMNSGKTLPYFRVDISLPSGQYIVKVVTERGNTAVYSEE